MIWLSWRSTSPSSGTCECRSAQCRGHCLEMICADLQARANLENKNSELADSVSVTASLLASLDPECSGSWQNRGILILKRYGSRGFQKSYAHASRLSAR